MLKRLNNDQWSSLFWFILGVGVCIASIRYDLGNFHNPGSGFLPFGAGLAISVFSIIGFVISVVSQKKGIGWKSPMKKGAMWRRTLLAVGALFAYALLLNLLGYTLCTALCVIFLSSLGRSYRWLVVIAGGILTAFASYGLFAGLLKVQFPKGPWGF